MNPTSDDFRILIVDDNRELRQILEEYLADEGYVEGADNGKEALARHREKAYDLIITDLNMPQLTGTELIKRIKEENEGPEFIIITAYASVDTAIDAVKLGAFDYIVKPFRIEEVRVVVKNAKDKILLKKVNAQLFNQLKGFYDEIARYKKDPSPEALNSMTQTEDIMREIKSFEKLKREGSRNR
jgi:two-component system, NtrC family, response regulator PilR